VPILYSNWPNPESAPLVVEALQLIGRTTDGRFLVDERTDRQRLREDGHAVVTVGSPMDPDLREAFGVLMTWKLVDQISPRPVSEFRMTELGWATYRRQTPWPRERDLPPAPAIALAPVAKDKPVSDTGASSHRYATSPGKYVDLGSESEDAESEMTVARVSG